MSAKYSLIVLIVVAVLLTVSSFMSARKNLVISESEFIIDKYKS